MNEAMLPSAMEPVTREVSQEEREKGTMLA